MEQTENYATSPTGLTADDIRKQMLAIWMRNPLGDVALDAAAVTLLTGLCQTRPEINDEKKWAPKPKQSPSTDPDNYKLGHSRLSVIRLSYLLDRDGLRQTLDALAADLLAVINNRRPVAGSMKLHLAPLVPAFPEIGDCELQLLAFTTYLEEK